MSARKVVTEAALSILAVVSVGTFAIIFIRRKTDYFPEPGRKSKGPGSE